MSLESPIWYLNKWTWVVLSCHFLCPCHYQTPFPIALDCDSLSEIWVMISNSNISLLLLPNSFNPNSEGYTGKTPHPLMLSWSGSCLNRWQQSNSNLNSMLLKKSHILTYENSTWSEIKFVQGMELEVLIQKIKKAWNNFFPRPRGGGLHHNLIVSLDKLLW